MPVNDGSNIRITPFQPFEIPDAARQASSLLTAMRRASGGGGGLGGRILFNPVTNQFERIPGGSPKERQLNMDAMNNMRVQAAWNNAKDTNVQAIQKKLQDFENASVERKSQIIDDIRRNDIPKLAGTSGIDGKAFIAGPLKELEQRQQEAAQAVARTGSFDVLWDSARIGLRNFTDSIADLSSNAQEQAARANARQQYIEQVRNENAYLQNSARRQAEGADFMDRFSGREVLAAAGEFAGQNIPTFGAMALGSAIGGPIGAAAGFGARAGSIVGTMIPGAVTGAGHQMTASVDAILSDPTKTTEQKMQELEDAQISSRAFGGALGAVVMPVGQGIRRAVSSGLANRGIGGSQVAQAVRNQRAGKALPDDYLTWDAARAGARRADIEAENALIRGRSLARFRQQAADSALEGTLFGAVGQLGTNVIAGDPLGTNMGAATFGGAVGGLGFTPFNRRTLRAVPDNRFVAGVDVPVGAPTDVNQQNVVDAAWNAYDPNRATPYAGVPGMDTVGPWSAPGGPSEFGFGPDIFNDIGYTWRQGVRTPDTIRDARFEERPVPNWAQQAREQAYIQSVQQQFTPRPAAQQQAAQPAAQQTPAPRGRKAKQQQQVQQQPNLQDVASSTPPNAPDNQVPASISADRLPQQDTGEMGINLVGPDNAAPSAVRQQSSGTSAPSATADRTITKALRDIISKGGKYRKGAPKGGLHGTSVSNIDRIVDGLTPEQQQQLVQLINQNGGVDKLSKVQYTRRAIQHAIDRINSNSPESNAAFEQAIAAIAGAKPGATPQELAAMTRAAQQNQEGANNNATTQQQQQTTVQGAGAKPAAQPQQPAAQPQQQPAAITATAVINAATRGGSEPQAAGLEQSVNAGAPAANRTNTGVDSGGAPVDNGTPATDANNIPESTPVVGQAAQERGNAGTEAQQPGKTPETPGTPQPKVAEQQSTDGGGSIEPATPADAEGGKGAGSPRSQTGTEQGDGGDAANAGGDQQPGNVVGDGNRNVVVTQEQADKQQVAASSFNVRVTPDGGITSSRDGWRYHLAATAERARKNVTFDQNGISYNVKRVANNDRNFTPSKTLYVAGTRTPQAPAVLVHISNADGATFDITLRNADATKYSPNWIPSVENTGITVDKNMILRIDPNTTHPELRRAMSGDGAMVDVTVVNNRGQFITGSGGQVGRHTFPLYPNEWAIKPTVSETLQAKADRDTAVAAVKDAKDNETSQKLVAPKAEGQNPADAETVEALAKITKEDAKTPVATPAREAVKTPPQRKAQAQKKVEEAATTTGRKKTEKKDEEAKPATTTRRRVIANTPPREIAPTEQQPVEQAPANPREDAVAQAEAIVEAKVDPHTESYDYGYDDGMATVAARLRDLQEEQIDAMADRIYELQEQGTAVVNQHPVSTEEAPAVVMAFVNDMPPKQLERVIQAAGVRNLSGYKRGGRQTVDPMMVAEDMTYALIANDIARQGADAGITLKLSPTDQAYISLANKQELPPVKLSAEEKALLDVWLGDATIPLRERQDIETAFDVITTTPDQARKRILEASQMAACDTASRRNNTRIRNDEAAAQRQAAANAAERAAEQRDIAKHNAEAREIRAEERNALGI